MLRSWTRAVYVDVEPQTMKAAIERAEADACSAVISITRISTEELARRAFWARVDAREPQKTKRRNLKLVSR